MLAAVKPSNQKADLYETIQIPVRQEFLSLTGNYESAVFLNQILFSNKEELTLNDIRRLSLSDRTKQTLRKKPDELVSLGLVTKRQHGQMYNRYLYKAANALNQKYGTGAFREGQQISYGVANGALNNVSLRDNIDGASVGRYDVVGGHKDVTPGINMKAVSSRHSGLINDNGDLYEGSLTTDANGNVVNVS